jgi:hypothetical protein
VRAATSVNVSAVLYAFVSFFLVFSQLNGSTNGVRDKNHYNYPELDKDKLKFIDVLPQRGFLRNWPQLPHANLCDDG